MDTIETRIQIPRRQLLKTAGLALASLTLGGCGNSLFEDKLQAATEPFNQSLEGALFNKYKLSTFKQSEIEPNALIVNTAEDSVPSVDPNTFKLNLNGVVVRPVGLSMANLKELPYVSIIIRHVCVEGWAAVVQWGGVPLSHLAKLCEAKGSARYVLFGSAGDLYYETWDIASCLHPQTILAYEKNYSPLPKEHGGPLRLASPIKLGYKLSKWVTSATFLTALPTKRGYWEDRGYEWYAGL